MASDQGGKTMTDRYTDVARTSVVTFGHGVSLAGAAMSAAGCPAGSRVQSVGDAISKTAVAVCSRDTPSLRRCNDG